MMVCLAERELSVVILPLFLNQQQAGICDGSANGIDLPIASLEIQHHRICVLAPPAQ